MPLSRGHQRHHRPDPVAAGTSSTEMPVLVVLTSMATMLEKPFGRYQFVKRIANALRGACTPRCRDERRKTASDVRRAATKIAKGNVLPIVGLRASAAPPEICQHTCTCCSTTQHISAVVSASELPAASELLAAMVAGGLVLTQAQRTLVEKSRAVKQQRAAALEAQHELDARARAHVQEIKTRCQSHYAPTARRLILRHVGEELARVAHRERQLPSKARSAPTHVSNNINCKASGPSAPSNHEDEQQQKPRSADDGYDEERFGSVRRPPRKQPPNLWVPIFEQEVAEVQQAKEEAERKRLAAAAEYRERLSQQEADKQRNRLDEKAVADGYARAQAAQQAAWREQEKAKQKERQDQVVLEAQRWQQDLRAQAEALRVAQEKKERNERRVLERFHMLDEQETRRKAERKAADMEEVVRVKQANAQQLELKRLAVLREQQQDHKLQQAYERKLEEQEAARRAELDAILVKQSHKVKLALLNVKSAEEKAREDEERALAVQAAVRARETELLELKERKKREAARAQVQALTLQKEEKKSRRLSLEQQEAVYASKFKADFQSWQKEQVAAKVKVHQRNREYQKLVRQQMSEDAMRRADEDKYGMTLLEAELNTKLLQKAGITSPPEDIHRR
ncbi:hypothetical protein PC128_g16106 [Phytophthora cactorum]|nr:hypothetical protein PC128_g16106 [Phytophthora cactorum]